MSSASRATIAVLSDGSPCRSRLDATDSCSSASSDNTASERSIPWASLEVARQFGYAKVRYRGLAKNRQQIALLLGFTNLLIAGRYPTG